MSFHSGDHAKYVESGQCLCDKALESVAVYFEKKINLQVADGSLAKKREHQIEHPTRCEMRHALRKQYNEKVCRIMEQHQGSDGLHSRQSNTYHCHNLKWQNCNCSGHCHNYGRCEKKQEDKTPSDRVQAILYAQTKEQSYLQRVLQEPQESKQVSSPQQETLIQGAS
jgi:hypothetical protein